MTEEFLHYLWRCGLYSSLSASPGENIEVIDRGKPNYDSGPDFFNAMIRLGDTMLAGNIEIHINASDWYRHNHHIDKAYDNVILQIVLNNDTDVMRNSVEVIPTAELRFDNKLYDNYKQLLDNEYWIPCESFIRDVDFRKMEEWLVYQSFNRLEQKAAAFGSALYNNHNDWQESFYQQLARNFGFNLNGSAFEILARSLPFRLLLRHRDNPFQLEALLFGQAGMLESLPGDEYYSALRREYQFLKRKYNLNPGGKHLWKFLRLRPANFPTIRIAQFASFLHLTPGFFRSFIEIDELDELKGFFNVSASGYWDNHYVFSKPSTEKVKRIGKIAIGSLIINTLVPVMYFYGKYYQLPRLKERAMGFLRELPPENNSIISRWRKIGLEARSALDSQALLQLKNEFCCFKRCLQCDIGKYVIATPPRVEFL